MQYGTFYITGDYGGSGGEESCFILAPNERITTVQIHHNNNSKLLCICALKFTISISNRYTQTNNQDPSVEGFTIGRAFLDSLDFIHLSDLPLSRLLATY